MRNFNVQMTTVHHFEIVGNANGGPHGPPVLAMAHLSLRGKPQPDQERKLGAGLRYVDPSGQSKAALRAAIAVAKNADGQQWDSSKPMSVELRVFVKRPKNWISQGCVPGGNCASGPSGLALGKYYVDVMKGVLLKDAKQVVNTHVFKRWAHPHANCHEGVEIRVRQQVAFAVEVV